MAYLGTYYAKARLGIRQPILCGIKLTHHCNLHCRQCPYWRREQDQLTWEQLCHLFPLLYQKGIRIVIFEGGEPMLWQDGSKNIHHLINLAKQYFYTVGLTTNGTLALDTDADTLWVSLDGLEATHDSLRGKSFQQIMTNLANSSHPRTFANITINQRNVREIPTLVRFLQDKVKGITIQFFYPYPESEDLTCSWEERIWVLTELQALKKQGLPIADSFTALEALKTNNWHCEQWMMANVDPDNTYTQGCYLSGRTASPACRWCGFAAHTEISLAYQLRLQAIWAGRRILDIF
ncbi:MAG TPA: radical SAM protein [Bacillota bacterium]|nr:radical SAM protein [Bacillota bacterium]